MRVGVIGLGKLGFPLACLLASNPQNEVSGLDIDQDKIWKILSNKFHIQEPDCNYNKLFATSSFEAFTERTDIAFLCVNTPTNSEGTIDLSQVISVCESLHLALKGKEYHLVVSSTVLPGTCRDIIRVSLGINVNIYSSPVWIAMGTVIKDLREPPVLVVGYDKDSYPTKVVETWLSISEVAPKNIIITDTRTAEFIKLAHNSWCCTKMSYMGYLKDQSERLDININDVSRFFQNGGERPGTFWKPGPSFSGPCFPRDLRFWNKLTEHPITADTELINEMRILDIVAGIPRDAKVLILGSGYKYGVQITEESLAFKLRDAFNKYHPETNVAIADNYSDSGYNPTHCIVIHKELEHCVPISCEAIDLW